MNGKLTRARIEIARSAARLLNQYAQDLEDAKQPVWTLDEITTVLGIENARVAAGDLSPYT